MQTIPVELGSRSYQVYIGAGLLAKAADYLQQAGITRALIVTDSNVAPLYAGVLFQNLRNAGLCRTEPLVVPAGEHSKSFQHLAQVLDYALAQEIDRKTALIALGGGVIGDLVGFAASIALRGIPFVQIPTTLLAQVDSSVGGKTAINAAQGKNLIGSFHQPQLVLADIDTLGTLPRREILAGYAEIVKYGAMSNAEFFGWLEQNGEKLLRGDTVKQIHAIATCCRMKASIVARDETETGERALLNLGHTFAHAFETASHYGMLHGEAVALGMVKAFELSVKLGHCLAEDATRLTRHLAASGLPTTLAGRGWKPDSLIATMRKDKKAEAGRLTFILAKGLGHAFIARDVDEKDVAEVLRG